MYATAAEFHLRDGDLEKANERMQLAVQMCRNQKLDFWAPSILHTAGSVLKKFDPEGAAEFFQSQLNHPNASETYKKEVLKALSSYQEMSGDFVASINAARAALDAVQKSSPDTSEEAKAQLDYGSRCVRANLLDLGLQPLKRAQQLAVKLDDDVTSGSAVYQIALGLMSIDRDEEARQVLVEEIKRIRSSDNLLMLKQLLQVLAKVQTKEGDFDAAAKTINALMEETAQESANVRSGFASIALSLKATNSFTKAVTKGSTEETMPLAIKLIKEAIDRVDERMDVYTQATKDQPTTIYQSLADEVNLPDYLSLAAFKAIAWHGRSGYENA